MQNKLKKTYSVKKEKSQKNTYTGVVEANMFSRLAESVLEIVRPVDIEFKIFNGYGELPEFQGQYKASVTLQCQRCLEALTTDVNHEFHFYVGREDQVDSEPAGYEVVSTIDGDLLDIISVIEDDIILNLPLIPKHKTNCNEYLLKMNKKADAEPKEVKKNPFAALEGFKANLKH